MEIATLFARIGIKSDTKGAENLLEKLKGIKVGLGITTIAAGAFIESIRRIAEASMNAALAFKNFKAETGANVEELQRWQAVADETSGAGQAVAESIKAISKNTADIKLGKGNISGFQLLGINPNQDPFKILDQLRTKTAGLSQAMKKNVLEQMGVSKDLIQTLELTNEEFQKISSNAFVVPQESINQIDAARKSTEQLKNGIKYFGMELTAQLAPAIIKINTAITEWIRKNKDGLIKDLKTAFEWIVKFVGAGINTVKMINAVVSGTVGWANAIKILIGVFAVLNASLLFSPIGLITAGIILLVAILDDLYVYSKGGKSLIGMLDKDNGLRKMADGIVEVSKALSALMNGDTKAMDKLIEKWGIWGKIIKGIADGLKITKELLSGDIGAFQKRQENSNTENQRLKKMSNADYLDYLKTSFGFGKKDKSASVNMSNRTEIHVHGNLEKDTYAEIKKDQKIEGQRALNAVDAQLGYGEK
jgi:hypothetical protein